MFSWFLDLFDKKTYLYLVVHYDILTGRTIFNKQYASKKLKKTEFPKNYMTYSFYYTKEVYLLAIFRGKTNYEG